MPATDTNKFFFGFINLDPQKRLIGGTVIIILALGWISFQFFTQLNLQHENEVKRLIEQDIRKDIKIEKLQNELIKMYNFRNEFYNDRISKLDSIIKTSKK
jgi:hypothetical protein